MSLWSQIGYANNPYGVEPLPSTSEGAGLLVGRDPELARLLTEIRSTDTHPTIEGENGVGKTSLVRVAAYEAMRAYEDGSSPQLFLPLDRPLQLTDDVERFELNVLHTILQSYERHKLKLDEFGFWTPQTDALQLWFDSPLIRGGGGGASVAGFGGQATYSASANTGAGFSAAGLASQVHGWLQQTFSSASSGGFVAIIDNLELLQTSTDARRTLENVRDNILSLPGVRWVLCGAKGIVRSAASSPRMSGRLGRPIELKPVADDLVPELVRRRLAHFAVRPDPEAPVSPEAFGHLYEVSNNNLRNALKHAQDFAIWLSAEGELEKSPEEKKDLLEVWMAEIADEYTRDAGLQPAQWKLFDQIAQSGGVIAPGEYEAFGYNSMQAMRFHLQRLEQANILDSTIDETDNRRRTISITSVGWLVRYRRAGFQPR